MHRFAFVYNKAAGKSCVADGRNWKADYGLEKFSPQSIAGISCATVHGSEQGFCVKAVCGLGDCCFSLKPVYILR